MALVWSNLDMMNGKYPIVPNWDMGVVDVRDVASLELLAMTKPEAAGKDLFAQQKTCL